VTSGTALYKTKINEEVKLMKIYTRPSIVEFGKATDLIQGCGGWGTEGWTFDDSDSRYRWLYTTRWVCICTSLSGDSCTPVEG
jgi:hypothetical protein